MAERERIGLTENAGFDRGAALSQSRPVRIGLLGTINALDPRKALDYVSGFILDQIFEPPFEAIAGQASAAPRLFEPLRNEDALKGCEYSAAIRPGIFFSDGTPLTPELAARSLRKAIVLAGKATVDVRGSRVWFTLSAPNPRFDLALTQSSCSIVFDNGHQLVGTGPFMFEKPPNLRALQRSPQLRLHRNPHREVITRVEELEFHVLPPDDDGTPRALAEALRSGNIDLTTGLSASDLATWKISGFVPLTKPSSSTAFLYMNTVQRPLNMALARKGIAATIDLLELASKSYDRNPVAFVATTALPPSMRHNAGAVRARADGARLIEASGLRGARLALVVPWCPRPYLLKPIALAQIIQRQLGDAGIVVSLVHTNSSDEYFTALTNGRFDLALGGWIADTADPADYFDALLSSHAIGNGNSANFSGWSDALTDAKLQRFRVNPNDANRREIEQLIADEVPFLPLVYGQSCVIHGRQIRNVTLSPTGSISLASLTVSS